MNFASLKPTLPRLQRSAVALALAAFGASASALPLPQFTVNGNTLSGLSQQSFIADNIIISDFALVSITGNTFTESGLLSVKNFDLGGNTVDGTGLGAEYNMYIRFTGTGTLTETGNPNLVDTKGSFQTLTYELFGYDGPRATFAVTPGGATETATGEVRLAFGSLDPGSVSTVSSVVGPGDGFSPSATTLLSFTLTDAGKGVFTAPDPFYNMAFAAFTNNPSQVTMFDGGFLIQQGGGSINFLSPIPEPETYALMLAGLAAVGFVARRRRPQA